MRPSTLSMTSAKLEGLQDLCARTQGSPKIRVAVLDGPVDVAHPCFSGALLEGLPTLVRERARPDGPASRHGTHIASLLFGQPGSVVTGLAPRCFGLLLPVFSDERGLTQLDLSRAIRQAVAAGAHVINISGGQLTTSQGSDPILSRSIQLCREHNVLVVAAAGNDGCACLHMPAALPTVLAVGAMDAQGRPLDQSNWGLPYQAQGLLAPGVELRGALPGGGVQKATGTSFATALVSGVTALLLSLQLRRGQRPDPHAVRAALLQSAQRCELGAGQIALQCLAGRLDIPGALSVLFREGETSRNATTDKEIMTEPQSSDPTAATAPSAVQAAACTCNGRSDPSAPIEIAPKAGDEVVIAGQSSAGQPSTGQGPSAPAPVAASAGYRPDSLIYALGVLGYDFGTEARRDSFKQLMPPAVIDGTTLPANPYDARQMVDYLGSNLSEGRSLIWTLNLELTPVYAIEPVGPFARDVYEVLHQMLDGQIQPEDQEGYIERVSLPGRLTDRTVRLFSGQILPVVEIGNVRGMYGWNVNALRDSAIAAVRADNPEASEQAARKSLQSFLNRVYYELRNLGHTSQERALNFAATNAFQVATAFSEAVGAGLELDSVEVHRSPFCRMDSDCWDVILAFFDADNILRARKMYRFTIDVSDTVPVTMGEIRSWSAR